MSKDKIVSILLVFILSMTMTTGCSKGGDSKNTVETSEVIGKYVEEDMSFPQLEKDEAMIELLCNTSGQIEYYTCNIDTYDIYCNTNTEGIWEKKPVTWANEVIKTYGFYPQDIILGEDQVYYIVGSNRPIKIDHTKQIIPKSYLVQCNIEDMKYNDVTPNTWIDEREDKSIDKIQVSAESILCYSDTDKVCLYDLKAGKNIPYNDKEIGYPYLLRGDRFFYYSSEDNSINCYDYKTSIEEKYSFPDNNFERFCMGADHRIYGIDHTGIRMLNYEDSTWETLMDGYNCNLGNKTYIPLRILCDPGDKDIFYIMYLDSEQHVTILSKYSYRTDIDFSSEKELTIYSLLESSTVSYAITEYTNKHPEIKITYRVLNNDTLVLLSDQIRTMNTEILAGKGPDIIVLDNLPMESYIEKGVLLDTSDIFMDMINNKTINPNIAKNYVIDDKVYAMPLRFFVPICSSRADMNPTSVEALAQLSKSIDQPLFGMTTYTSLIQKFIILYADQIMNEDGYLDKEAFRNFLLDIKSIGDESNAIALEDANTLDSTTSITTYNDSMNRLFFNVYYQILDGNSFASMGYLNSNRNLWNTVWCSQEAKGSLKTVNDTYIPCSIIGINNSTKQKEIAKDFVKSLYEEELQSKDVSEGYPLNTKALDKWLTIDDSFPKEITSFSVEDGKQYTFTIDQTTFDSTTIKNVREMILSLSKPAKMDTVLQSIIAKGTIPYFTGEKSLEQVTEEVTNTVNLYIGE